MTSTLFHAGWSLGLVVILGLAVGSLHGTVVISGDVYIQGIFSLYENENGNCGTPLLSSVQHMEAVKWAVNLLNDDNYVTGITIGLKVHATCNSDDRALEIAYNLSKALSEDGDTTIAVIGPEKVSEVSVVSRLLSSLPARYRPLQVAFSADSNVLNDKAVFQNLLRVIPEHMTGTKMLGRFFSDKTWTYLSIFHDNTPSSLGRISDLQGYVRNNGRVTCFPETIAVPENGVELIKGRLKSMYEGDVPISGALVIGGRQLMSNFFNALDFMNTNTTTIYESPTILLDEDYPLSVLSSNITSPILPGAFSLSPLKTVVSAFKAYWESSVASNDNTTSTLQLQQLRDALVSEEIEDKVEVQSVHTSYALKSSLVVTSALKEFVDSKCQAADKVACVLDSDKNVLNSVLEGLKVNLRLSFIGINEFKELTSTLSFSSMSTGFDENSGDQPVYGVYSYVRSSSLPSRVTAELIAEFPNSDNAITYHDDKMGADFPKPQCPDGKLCTGCPVKAGQEIKITKGDMYVVGIVPVHTISNDPLKCGSTKNGGYDVAAAIEYAVDYVVRTHPSKVPTGKIGVILIDSCNNAQIVTARLLQLLNNGILEDGQFVEVKSKILGYVGGWVSDISIAVASILTRVGSVQISYGSTSPTLSDRIKYPYFMRMIPNDDHQAVKIVDIIKRLGSNFIQILYSETAYGIGGKVAVEREAKSNGMCVSQSVGVPQKDSIDKQDIVQKLSAANQPTLIVVYLSSFDVVKLIDTLKTMKGYVFVASEGWGNRDILSKAANLNGSITLANELVIDQILKNFNNHLESQSKAEDKGLWLSEYIQDYFNCYHEGSFDKSKKGSSCNSTQYFKPHDCYSPAKDLCFKVESWAPFAGVGVETLLYGARATLDHFCGDSTAICQAYLDNPRALVKNIVPIQVAIGNSKRPVYDSETQDGLIDLNTYMIRSVNGEAEYRPLENDWQKNYKYDRSTCSLIQNPVCQTPKCFGSEEPPDDGPTKESMKEIVMIVFIAVSVVLLIALVVIIIAWRKQALCCKETKPNFYNDRDNGGYISPTHDSGYLTTFDLPDRQTSQSDRDTSAESFDECSTRETIGSIQDGTGSGQFPKNCSNPQVPHGNFNAYKII